MREHALLTDLPARWRAGCGDCVCYNGAIHAPLTSRRFGDFALSAIAIERLAVAMPLFALSHSPEVPLEPSLVAHLRIE
jgi:hypothetical protein